MGLLLWTLIALVLLTLLWNISAAGKYYIKWTLFGVICVLSATLPIPLMLLRPKDPRNAL